MNTRLSIARMLAATTVRPGLPGEGNGNDDPVRVDQFHNAEGQAGLPRQSITCPDVAYTSAAA
jgi:hypothetical protein